MSRPRSSCSRGRGAAAWLAAAMAALAIARATGAEAWPAAEPSAFLRAHAGGPVAWMPWGAEAFERAKRENKPVFVFVGAFASELSRAMREQSFARPDVAAQLGGHFVCVLVDREERPDVAALCQQTVRVVKQLQGWPLNVWLTPELQPFEAATYLPPGDEWGKEGFVSAARRVAAAWSADPEAQRRKAAEALAMVRAAGEAEPPAAPDAAAVGKLLGDGAAAWRAVFDAAHPGFGEPPRYPEPELLRFLLREAQTREMALATLRAIVAGAMRDPLDGGFFRYATDAAWNRPTLQKSLADQARLALALLEAAEIGGEGALGEAARGALDYALGRGDPQAGFAAMEDATAAGGAAFFLWSEAQVRDAVGDESAADEFCRACGVAAAGNLGDDGYEGVPAGLNLLRRAGPAGDADFEQRLAATCAKLRHARSARPPPAGDEAATTAAHGLMLAALARAGAQLHEPRFTEAAAQTLRFLRDRARGPDGALLRYAGRPYPAAPVDYACVAAGLAEWQRASGDAAAGRFARELCEQLDAQFLDPARGRYFAAAGPLAPGLGLRVHAPAPAAGEMPSAEAIALGALLALAGDRAPGGPADRLARGVAAALADRGAALPGGGELLALRACEERR